MGKTWKDIKKKYNKVPHDPERVVLPFNADTIREDGRLERTCKHGVGHTVGHLRGWLWDYETVHGCDGDCKDWPRQDVLKHEE